MKMYDLRSDTITKPTDGMRRAMYDAEVGDDVYGEDPSINRLQEMSAELVGKEAAIYVPTGSMGNLIPIYLLCGRGNELIANSQAHILHYEMTAVASIAGAMPVPVDGERGILDAQAVESRIRAVIYYMPRTKLIEIENTHNLAGGTCYKKADLSALAKLARARNLKIHLDGARLFNAVTATGMDAVEICSHVDTVTFCLSKGLGAPVGSVLCGERSFIDEARRVRKLLGGGMRQAGILASAGIYAIENNIERLSEDHKHARRIAETLAETPWAAVDLDTVETNIIRYKTIDIPAQNIAEKLKAKGILCSATGPRSIRMVTSLEVSTQDTDEICRIIGSR